MLTGLCVSHNGSLTAEPFLRKVLTHGPSAEVRKRIENVVAGLTRTTFTPGELGALRAVEALEHMEAPDALEVLEGLAKGSAEQALTREAKAALDRLAARPVP